MQNLTRFHFFKPYNRFMQNTMKGVSVNSHRAINFSNPFLNRGAVPISGQYKEIPHLLSLDKMGVWGKSLGLKNLDSTYLVGVQHFLPTTAAFFEGLIKLGVKPDQMLFTDKVYSTVPEAVSMIQSLGVGILQDEEMFRIGDYNQFATKKQRALWDRVLVFLKNNPHIKTIIILDEGGRCIEQIPQEILLKYKIIAIEQTRGGLYNSRLSLTPFPVINVAASAVKKTFESRLIADALIRCLERKLPDSDISNMQVGIIGYGAIGQAVAEYFINKGHKIFIYDKDIDVENRRTGAGEKLPNGVVPLTSEQMVAINSDCVLGCTGKDITEKIDAMSLVRDTVIVSCSSEDKEVKSLIKKIANVVENKLFIPPMNDLILLTDNDSKILIPNGGCPINFDKTAESDPHEMALTRLLLMGSILQCLVQLAGMEDEINVTHQDVMLDPYIQYLAAQLWKEEFAVTEEEQLKISSEDFLDYIKDYSGGNFVTQCKIKETVNTYRQLLAQYDHDVQEEQKPSSTLTPT